MAPASFNPPSAADPPAITGSDFARRLSEPLDCAHAGTAKNASQSLLVNAPSGPVPLGSIPSGGRAA